MRDSWENLVWDLPRLAGAGLHAQQAEVTHFAHKSLGSQPPTEATQKTPAEEEDRRPTAAIYTQIHRRELTRWPHPHRRGVSVYTSPLTLWGLGGMWVSYIQTLLHKGGKMFEGARDNKPWEPPPHTPGFLAASPAPLHSYRSYSAMIWPLAILQLPWWVSPLRTNGISWPVVELESPFFPLSVCVCT